jgi:Peptidase family M23
VTTTVNIGARRADPVRPGDKEWEEWLKEADLSPEEFNELWKSRFNSAKEFVEWMQGNPADRWAVTTEKRIKDRVQSYKESVQANLDDIQTELNKPVDQIKEDLEKLKEAVNGVQETVNTFVGCYSTIEISKHENRIQRFLLVGLASCMTWIFVLHPLVKSGIGFANATADGVSKTVEGTKNLWNNAVDAVTGNVELGKRLDAQSQKWVDREFKQDSNEFVIKILSEVGVKATGNLFDGGEIVGDVKSQAITKLEDIKPGDIALSESGEVGFVVSTDQMITVKDGRVTKSAINFKSAIRLEGIKRSEAKGVGNKTISLMRSLNYQVDPKMNLVFLRGYYCNTFDSFCDLQLLVDGSGKVLFQGRSTTKPGSAGYKNPVNSAGTFSITPGQYLDAWEVGQHCGMTSGRCQEALVQRKAIKGTRSLYSDRRNPVSVSGIFGINIHGSREGERNIESKVSGYSLGCLVSVSMGDHRELMKLIKKFNRPTYSATVIDINVNPLPADPKPVTSQNATAPATPQKRNGTLQFGFPLKLEPEKAKVGSGFGPRTHPVTKKKGTPHNGVDIGVPKGTEIVAIESGVVTYAGLARGCGGMVVIKHSDRFESKICHASKILVKAGDRVSKGDVTAHVGGIPGEWGAGTTTGAHLHFEVHDNGVAQNPFKYVPSLIKR